MKVIKCINNNVAICVDGNNRQLIAFGSGIGFKKPPFEVALSQIERTFYDIDLGLISMIDGLDEKVIPLSAKIVEYARDVIDNPISANIVFSLADHIDFTIRRNRENTNIKLPIVYDIQYLYEKEFNVGEYAVKLIQDEMKVYLPKEEAGYIAMHFINSEYRNQSDELAAEEIIEHITVVVENTTSISINRDGANYARFVTHMHYLLKRGKNHELHETENIKMYESLAEKYPLISECVDKIASYFKEVLKVSLNEEEKLYLILHINRLCDREETN